MSQSMLWRAAGLWVFGFVGLFPSEVRADPPDPWQRLEAEPGIEAVQAAVRARETPPGLAEYAGTSRWAWAMPHRLSVRFRQRDQTDITGVLYDDEGWRRTVGADGDVSWQVDAEWDLARLVHNPDWLKARRALDDARRRADDTVDLATRLYFERRQLQLQYLDPRAERDPRIRDVLWLRIAALTARLDVLTGGLYRRAAVRWWQGGGATSGSDFVGPEAPPVVAAPPGGS